MFGHIQGYIISQINPNLYAVSRSFVLKIQNDRCNRAKVVAGKPSCLQTDDHDDDRPITFFLWSYNKIKQIVCNVIWFKWHVHVYKSSGAGLPTLLEHLSSPPGFCEVRVTRSLVLCVCFVDRCLSFCPFSFGHCIVCPSSICGFWLSLLVSSNSS